MLKKGCFHLPKFIIASVLILFVTSCVGVNNTVDIGCDSGLATVIIELYVDFEGLNHPEIYPDVDTWVESFTESLSLQGEGAWAWRRDPGDIHDMDWEITGSNIPIENLSLLGMQTTVTIEDTSNGRIINIVAVAESDLFARVDAWNTTGEPTELNHNLSISGGIILDNNAETVYLTGEDDEHQAATWNLEPGQEARIRLREIECPVDNTMWLAGGIILAILAVFGIAWWLARHPNNKLRRLTAKIRASFQSIRTLIAGLGASLRISLFGWVLVLAFFVVYFFVGSESDLSGWPRNFGVVLFGAIFLMPSLAIIWIIAIAYGIRTKRPGNSKERSLDPGIGPAILGLLLVLALTIGLIRF